jgi:hypothetical protein
MFDLEMQAGALDTKLSETLGLAGVNIGYKPMFQKSSLGYAK